MTVDGAAQNVYHRKEDLALGVLELIIGTSKASEDFPHEVEMFILGLGVYNYVIHIDKYPFK